MSLSYVIPTMASCFHTFFCLVPSQPQNFRGFSVEADSIQLMWSIPEVPRSQRLLGYRLWYAAASSFAMTTSPETTIETTVVNSGGLLEQSLEVKAEATQFILKDLQPGTLYHLRLEGRSSNGFGAAAMTEVRTQEYRKWVLFQSYTKHLQKA